MTSLQTILNGTISLNKPDITHDSAFNTEFDRQQLRKPWTTMLLVLTIIVLALSIAATVFYLVRKVCCNRLDKIDVELRNLSDVELDDLQQNIESVLSERRLGAQKRREEAFAMVFGGQRRAQRQGLDQESGSCNATQLALYDEKCAFAASD